VNTPSFVVSARPRVAGESSVLVSVPPTVAQPTLRVLTVITDEFRSHLFALIKKAYLEITFTRDNRDALRLY
jgi:hypothetical protein